MHERQDLGETRGKSETEKARQNLESEVLVWLNGLSEMSGLRPRSRDGRKSRTVTTGLSVHSWRYDCKLQLRSRVQVLECVLCSLKREQERYSDSET